jgi:hypothetical protein
VARQRVEYLDMPAAPMLPALDQGLPLGMLAATLSQDDDSGAASWLTKTAPQWQQLESGYFNCNLELLVVAGDLTVGDLNLTRGSYCYWPAGSWLGPMRSEQGCEALLMSDAKLSFNAAASASASADHRDRIDNLATLAMPWELVPAVEGRSVEAAGTDLAVKFFRNDPDTGAYTLVARQAGGWGEPKLEAHECWEELILIEGDYLMGTNGLVEAGCYIFRPEKIPHGPQATRKGSVWLSRGNQTIDFQFTETDWAEDAIADYLAVNLKTEPVRRTPWGIWSD